MEMLALILALTVSAEQAQAVLTEYIQEHPEAVINVDVATTEEVIAYLNL